MKLTIRQKAEAKRKNRRQQLIQIVKRGIADAGAALIELRDDEHWKDSHANFAEFCRDTFAISKTDLYRAIKGVQVIGSVSKELRQKITSQSQIEALAKIPESNRDAAITKAENNGGITAENLLSHGGIKPVTKPVTYKPSESRIRNSTFLEKSGSETTSNSTTEVVDKKPQERKLREIIYDEIGTPLPDDALPFWNRRKEIQDLLTSVSRIKSQVVKGKDTQDPMYSKVSPSAISECDMLRHHLKEAMPYAVCTVCQGTPSLQPQGCAQCGNKGLISEYQWLHQSPIEIKELRCKSNAAHARSKKIAMPTVRLFPVDSTQKDRVFEGFAAA